ncbi:MAG: CotH kinase family protein [Saprospirales bacterium]|nr:CotH kinase family protein [Saprospirales bacterium]
MRKFAYTAIGVFWGLLVTVGSWAQSSGKDYIPDWEVELSVPGGFYPDAVEVDLSCPGARIYYTMDGSVPKAGSINHLYRGPIPISTTTVLRILAVRGSEHTRVISHTFFINEPLSTFPVVSISIPPDVLFHPTMGLFVKGPEAVDTLLKMPGANFWSKGEFPINAEIFETDGSCVFRNEMGFRLFGGMSRLFPQKSFAVVARDRYGVNRIDHSIFGKKGLKKFKFLVFRNSGSDFGKTQFRDAFMTSLVKDWEIDVQDFRPSHVYINGKYWGIYNIREKINRYYIAAHHDVEKDSLDLLEHRFSRKRGSRRDYLQLLNFMEKNSLWDATNFAYVDSQMDVGNFMDYEIAQIYFDNQDAGGNIRYWKANEPGSKWRWILYDTDWGFGLHESDAYANNSLAFHTAANGPAWPNPPWSTFILRKLLENPEFKRTFINRFADQLNTSLSGFHVEQQIDSFQRLYEPEIPRHLERWNLSQDRWLSEIEKLRIFARKRPEFVRMHIMEQFDVGDMRDLQVLVNEGGTVKLNGYVHLVPGLFEGVYFEKIPVTLEATPALGFRFLYWEGPNGKVATSKLTLSLREDPTKAQAVFERYDHPLAGKIIINEVACNNKVSGDWIELYNQSDETVQLSGWMLTDSKNNFMFPNILVPSKGYLVICEDVDAFLKAYPDAYRYVGNLGFGLSKRKERIGLFSSEGALVDSMGYDLAPMDSLFTLNLLLPTLNNGDPENWDIQTGMGTPDAANIYYVQSTLRARQKVWVEMGAAAGVIVLCIFLLIWRHRSRRPPRPAYR